MKKPFVLAVLLLLFVASAQAQDALSRTRQILTLLRQEKFADVTKDFNPQMAAAMNAQTLSQIWTSVKSDAGGFKSEISQQVADLGVVTIVTMGCQFERLALNLVIVFDADNKISSLQFAPRQPEPVAVAPPAGLVEQAFMVGTGEFALPGTLTLPRGTGRVPAVILVHGSGPLDRDSTAGPNKPFRDLAWGLASRGVAVLRYEKRTKEHAAKMAAIPNITVREETIDDAVLAAQALRKHDRIDARHVFVLGHSLGGMVAPRIAQADRMLTGLILMAANSRPVTELVIEQTAYIGSLSGNAATQQAAIDAMKLQVAKINDPALPMNTPASELMGAPPSYWKDLNAYKPGAVAATLTVPMLILQGERDYQVSMKDFEGWRESLKGRAKVTLKSYPDLNHLFMAGTGKSTPAEYEKPGKVADSVINDIADWIKKN